MIQNNLMWKVRRGTQTNIILIWGCFITLLFLPWKSEAIGEASNLHLVQLLYKSAGTALPRPNGLKRLAWELEKRTSLDVKLTPVLLKLNDKVLFEYPFLYLGGDKGFKPLTESEMQRLHRFLIFGGFLLIDSADARPGGDFDKSVRELIAQVFPKAQLKKVSKQHSLYSSFYLMSEAVGRVSAVPGWEAVELNGRIVILYSQNDLAGAWAQDNLGQWDYNVYPGDDQQREQAIRWGVNILMYALCGNYKADQVHVPFLLKRRQWKVTP